MELPVLQQPVIRQGQTDVKLTRDEFAARFRERFYDPAFDEKQESIEELLQIAWDGYDKYRKSPRTRKAGDEFADPDYDLPIEWLATRAAIAEAQNRHDTATRDRVLVICGSPRSDQTCPGEMSKTFRIANTVKHELELGDVDVDLMDLSRLTAEYGRVIYPCKSCVSTAMPLCHWPCSCYPNHAIGQVNDWMSEVYPRWVEAHGVLIVTPVQWYQTPSTLTLMIDRLVCADGGNPDQTTTHGKTPAEAKQLELQGWSYPKHLGGRSFGLIVHGDAAGIEQVTSALHGWLTDMHLVPADGGGILARYIGYYEPYATSHDALDADTAFMEESRIAARALVDTMKEVRSGRHPALKDRGDPRPK